MEKSDDESNGYKDEGPGGWDKYNIRSPKTKTKTETETEIETLEPGAAFALRNVCLYLIEEECAVRMNRLL
ncbi:hypothetical protein CMV_014223 [Castanea mollissima]|uniref:Uncharacterized protein n=1 Tax=Castanea mollissima TaxID=60419 RepID=A0A8J4VL44_9ROSI|nr:hypothetical protein CMV_014223 [Castanea mollissima]